MQFLSKIECDGTELDQSSKNWVSGFFTVYQCKGVTPYIHCFGMHVSQF